MEHKRSKAILAAAFLWAGIPAAQAFVLMGPSDVNEVAQIVRDVYKEELASSGRSGGGGSSRSGRGHLRLRRGHRAGRQRRTEQRALVPSALRSPQHRVGGAQEVRRLPGPLHGAEEAHRNGEDRETRRLSAA